jgi:hypothetical protein
VSSFLTSSRVSAVAMLYSFSWKSMRFMYFMVFLMFLCLRAFCMYQYCEKLIDLGAPIELPWLCDCGKWNSSEDKKCCYCGAENIEKRTVNRNA